MTSHPTGLNKDIGAITSENLKWTELKSMLDTVNLKVAESKENSFQIA